MALVVSIITVPYWNQSPKAYVVFGLPYDNGILPVFQSCEKFLGEILTPDWGYPNPQGLLPSNLRDGLNDLIFPDSYRWRLHHYNLEDWESLPALIDEEIEILSQIVRQNQKLIEIMPKPCVVNRIL